MQQRRLDQLPPWPNYRRVGHILQRICTLHLLQILLFTLPLYVGYALLFNVSWFVRIRIQKSEYTDADKEYLTGRALVGAELIDSVKVYEGYTDDEKAELVARELWDDDNLREYKREIKPADKKSGKEKQAARRAKKGGDGGVGMLE